MKPNKRHLKYFQKNDMMRSVGIALFVLFAILFFFGRGVITYYIMVALLPMSIAAALIGTVGRSTDAEIFSVIKIKTEGMEVDLQNNERIGKNLIKAIDVLTVEGYEFRDGFLIKRAKNNELRTPEYCRAVLYPLRDCLYVVRVRIDILTECAEKDVLEIPYETIADIGTQTKTVEVSSGKKIYAVKASHLVIKRTDGEDIKLPIRESAIIDSFAEQIKHHMAGDL